MNTLLLPPFQPPRTRAELSAALPRLREQALRAASRGGALLAAAAAGLAAAEARLQDRFGARFGAGVESRFGPRSAAWLRAWVCRARAALRAAPGRDGAATVELRLPAPMAAAPRGAIAWADTPRGRLALGLCGAAMLLAYVAVLQSAVARGEQLRALQQQGLWPPPPGSTAIGKPLSQQLLLAQARARGQAISAAGVPLAAAAPAPAAR